MCRVLYVIDHSNWCYKITAALKGKSLASVGGSVVDTSLLVGYARSLAALPFDDILIALDGSPKQALSLLPTYKGDRHHEPGEHLQVRPVDVLSFITSYCGCLGKRCWVVGSPCQEADQVIASVVHMVVGDLPSRVGFVSRLGTFPLSDDARLQRYGGIDVGEFHPDAYDSVVLATTDADMYQLLKYPNVYIDTSTSGCRVSRDCSTNTVAQCSSFAIPIYKAVYGDSSDCIPPLPGYGIVHQRLLDRIRSVSDQVNFIEAVEGRYLLDDVELRDFAASIHDNCLSLWRRNLVIARLCFVSYPRVFVFPEVDVLEFSKKYNLPLSLHGVHKARGSVI